MQDPIARLEAAGFTVKTISALPTDAIRAFEADGSKTPHALTPMASKEADAMIEAVATLRANGFERFAAYVQTVPVVFVSDTLWNGAPNDNTVMATLGGDGATMAFSLNVNATVAFDGPTIGNPWAMGEGRAIGGDAGEAFTLKAAALHEMGHALDFRVKGAASDSLVNVVVANAPRNEAGPWVKEHVSDYAYQSGSPEEAEAEQFSKVAMGRPLTAPFAAWSAAVADIARTGDFKEGRDKLEAI